MLEYLTAEHGFEYANVWLAQNGFLTLLGAVGYPDLEAYAARTSPMPLSSPLDVVKVFTSGQPVVVSDPSRANPAARGLYADLGLTLGSYVILPLMAHETTVGTLNFGWREPRLVEPADLDFYLSLSSELGVVLENARLYKAQQYIATTLQENLVHPLPCVEGLELASLSLPAYRPELIGGDFRDVFPVSDNRVVVLIGDVMGKGVKAAGLTETVHSAVRALALVTASPAKILRHVNRLLLAEEHEQFVSALVAMIDPATGRCRLASAAHPPPVLLTRDMVGWIEPSYSPPLGTFDSPFDDHEFNLANNETLIFYTDGLTEARREGRLFGEARLLEVLTGNHDLAPEELVAHLRDAVLAYAGTLQDDLEILAVRRSHVAVS